MATCPADEIILNMKVKAYFSGDLKSSSSFKHFGDFSKHLFPENNRNWLLSVIPLPGRYLFVEFHYYKTTIRTLAYVKTIA